MNTPTPRTDAIFPLVCGSPVVVPETISELREKFAELERDLAAREEELAQALEARDEYRDAVIQCNREVVREQQRAERAEADRAADFDRGVGGAEVA